MGSFGLRKREKGTRRSIMCRGSFFWEEKKLLGLGKKGGRVKGGKRGKKQGQQS